MAPDKIYLNRIHPEPYWFNDKQVDSDIEYIRKDALIEWTNKMLQDTVERLDFRSNQAFAELYSKLISM